MDIITLEQAQQLTIQLFELSTELRHKAYNVCYEGNTSHNIEALKDQIAIHDKFILDTVSKFAPDELARIEAEAQQLEESIK
jgi:hypothetical protein